MKKAMKKMVVLLCICSLCTGTFAQAAGEGQVEELGFFEDGDVVGFIGDSITYAVYSPVGYVEALYQYYLSYFPDRRVELRHLGASGYKLCDVLDIYDRDPAFRGINKAVIMLGTNEAILEIPTEEYICNMEALIGRLKGDGLKEEDILILTPPICDENCIMNYDRNGNLYWSFESRLLEYIQALKAKSEEWGVHYLDLHTPMVEITEEIQKESNKNSLTIDCIHPSPVGQMLIAYYILQAQGVIASELVFTKENVLQTGRGEVTDFYRSNKGLCWTYKPEVLPIARTDEVLEFFQFYEPAKHLYQRSLQVKGLLANQSYDLLMGEIELGSFTGEELEGGIDLTLLDTHPLQASMQQMEARNRERHQEAIDYRAIWIQIMMKEAEYTPDQIQEAYEKWQIADEELRNEMYAIAQGSWEDKFLMVVIEEDGSIEELKQEAQKEAEERARREAEERAKKEAQERARKEAEEQAKREAEEQTRREQQRLIWGLVLGVVVVGLISGLAYVRQMSKKKQKRQRKKRKKRSYKK